MAVFLTSLLLLVPSEAWAQNEQPEVGPGPERGYLGAVVDDREDRGRGVRIERIVPGGPAEKAGLRKGDLITGVAGIRVRQVPDFAGIVEQVAAGSTLTFEVLRGNQREQIDVTFGQRAGTETRGPLTDVPAPLDLRGSDSVAPPIPPPPSTAIPSADAAPPPGDDRGRIEMLERRIEQLERRIEALERMVSRQFAQ